MSERRILTEYDGEQLTTDEFGQLWIGGWLRSHNEAVEWLCEIKRQQETFIHQLRGTLGYPVPGHIIENPNIVNGTAVAMEKQANELEDENERLKGYLRSLRSNTPYGLYQDQITEVLKDGWKRGESQ